MIDITATMESFIAGKAGWRRQRGAELARATARQLGGELDWDEDAGEDWARVLTGGKVAVLVSLTGPLAIVIGDRTGWSGPEASKNSGIGEAAGVDEVAGAGAGAVVVIEVPELDATVLRCDPGVLRAAFGDRVVDNPALDADAFSAGDLWFCTV